MPNSIAVNRRYFDMTTVRVTGFPYVDQRIWASHIRAVKFGRTITPGEVYGTSGLPIARTPGTQKANCSLTVVFEAWASFLQGCRNANTNGLSSYDLDIRVNFVMPGNVSNQLPLVPVRWVNASILSDDMSGSQGGTDGITCELVMWAQDITIFDVSLYNPDYDVAPSPIQGFTMPSIANAIGALANA